MTTEQPALAGVLVCVVPGCTKPREGNRATGLCAMHRSRQRRGIPDCAIEGCARRAVRGVLCRPHRLGSKLTACGICGGRHRTALLHSKNGKPYWSGYAPRSHEATCAVCGATFATKQGNAKWCSDACKRRAPEVRDQRRHAKHARKARLRGGGVEVVYRTRVFERDGWRCQLCGRLVARARVVPHPLAPTLDHIVPLAAGGEHSYRNVQLAHFICNRTKSDRGGAQLRWTG